jgi:thiamine-phosphate pyrophosphorylase
VLVPRLHVITPVVPVASLRPLVTAGVDAIQVRDKAADDRELLEFVGDVLALGITVIVNDRVDVALATGAHGVHLGARDLPVGSVRLLAPELLIGATCRSREDALAARAAGASYVGVGPVFASTTKPDLPAPLGVVGLAEVRGVLPVIAIGGITAGTVPSLTTAGAHGVAVVAAVSQAPDPPAAARELASALRVA